MTLAGVLGLLFRINPVLPVVLGAVTVGHIVAEQRMGHARFRERVLAAVKEMRAVRMKGARTTILWAMAHGAVVAGGFVYVADWAASGALSPGDVALFLNVVVQAATVSWGMSFIFVYGHENLLNVHKAFRGRRPPGDRPASRRSRPGVASPTGAGHRLVDVRFRYPEGDKPVLDGLSALLPPGKVNRNCGRTREPTLVQGKGRFSCWHPNGTPV